MSNFNYATATSNFLRALGNGQSALKELDGIVQAVASDRNSGHIVNLLDKIEKKGDTVAAGVVRFVTGQVFKGAKITKGKGGQKIIKIAGIEPDQKVITAISKAALDGMSLRSNKLRPAVMGEKGEAPKVDLIKKAENTAKAMSVRELQAYIAALGVALNAKKAPKI